MPTYDYRCRDCNHEFEIQQSFSDDSLTECPQCGGSLRKVFGNVGISFKGSGFYKTDSRNGSTSGSKTSSSSESSGDAGSSSSESSSSSSDSKSDATKSGSTKSDASKSATTSAA